MAVLIPAFVFTFVSTPALAGDHDDEAGDGNGQGQGNPKAAGSNGHNQSDTRLPGRFNLEGGEAEGRNVMFSWNADACVVRNYTVHGTVFFSRIVLALPCQQSQDEDQGELEVRGARILVEAPDSRLRLHDTPNGLISFQTAENGWMRAHLAPDVVIEPSVVGYALAVGNTQARLISSGGQPPLLQGDTLWFQNGHDNFIVVPPRGLDLMGHVVREALTAGGLAAQVDVLLFEGAVVAESMVYGDGLLRATQKGADVFRFLVDSNVAGGRLFAFNFANQLLDSAAVGVRYLTVNVDDYSEQEVPISSARTVGELLLVGPDESPKYMVLEDSNAKHVVVAVPKSSLHAIEVWGIPAQLVPVVLYGIVFGLLFALVSAFGMFFSRRRPA